MEAKTKQTKKTIGERLAEKPRVFNHDSENISEREVRKKNCYSHWDERYHRRQND